jgi:hypothetical protein
MSTTKNYFFNNIEEEQRSAIAETRDYPILFDTEMVQSILSGTKTETRRLFKSPLSKAMEPAQEIWHNGGKWIARLKNGQCNIYTILCPWGKPGDYLWVKETFTYDLFGRNVYRASQGDTEGVGRKFDWTPSIHMPKTKARLWLQITEIKAQRVQSVTDEEARQEGVTPAKIYGFGEIGQSNFREGFFAKWISIYGIESYYENPWVWAIKFNLQDSKPSIIS